MGKIKSTVNPHILFVSPLIAKRYDFLPKKIRKVIFDSFPHNMITFIFPSQSQRAGGLLLTETTFTFYISILTLSKAFLSINNREMKSESGFRLAMASQPFTRVPLKSVFPQP